jgi:hypothetical protein
MTDIVVHTLEARDNFLLQFMQDRFRLNNVEVGQIIVDAAERTTAALRNRGVEYAALEGALTPSADRMEVALIFAIARTGSGWYGREIHGAFLPLLGQDGSHSVLHGDLLGAQGQVESWLSIHLAPGGHFVEPGRGTEFYCIHVNNCSPATVARLNDGLSAYPPYLGYADVTYGSEFKTYLSATLVSAFVQHRQIVVQRHEDDLPDDANQNTLGYAFDDAAHTRSTSQIAPSRSTTASSSISPKRRPVP